MIDVGSQAPGFTLKDQFGRELSLESFRGKTHIALLFYPLDFSPTCSQEVPEVQSMLSSFAEACTLPVAVSIDSTFCHAAWAQHLGGISYPILADFHPKGAVAKSFGCYLDAAGITDRATVVIDADGVVRFTESVGPGGRRDMKALQATCAKVHAEYGKDLDGFPQKDLPASTRLFIRPTCGVSSNVLGSLKNLQAEGQVQVLDVSEDQAALDELKNLTGNDEAPCLVVDGQTFSGDAILQELVTRRVGFWS